MAFEATKLPHEKADIRPWPVLILVIGFIGFVAALMIALGFFYRSNVRSGSLESTFRQFPAPQLQPNATQDYIGFHKEQLDQLAGTRWVDKGKTLLHVPIERAMALVAARGAAAYDPLDPPTDKKPPATPQDDAARLMPSAPVAPYGTHP